MTSIVREKLQKHNEIPLEISSRQGTGAEKNSPISPQVWYNRGTLQQDRGTRRRRPGKYMNQEDRYESSDHRHR